MLLDLLIYNIYIVVGHDFDVDHTCGTLNHSTSPSKTRHETRALGVSNLLIPPNLLAHAKNRSSQRVQI